MTETKSDEGFWGCSSDEFMRRHPEQVERAQAILVADSRSPFEWFCTIFDREPEVVAGLIVHDPLLREDIVPLCFELRGDNDEWTQKLCDELATLIVEHGYYG